MHLLYNDLIELFKGRRMMYNNRTNHLSIHENENIYYITFPSFEATKLVKHCFSTRLGGISKGEFQFLNLGFGRGDEDKNVYDNYERLCNVVGLNSKQLVFANQIHDTKIKIITNNDLNVSNRFNIIKGTDGLITNLSKVPLVTVYADCVPLFFLDPYKKIIGLAHGGWRGTVKKIALEMIKIFIRDFNSNPKEILAAIGPSIGKCCFEVDEPVAKEFRNAFDNANEIIDSIGNNKYMIDLWEANKKALLEGGLLSSNITVTDLCTKCNNDIFFSHRGDQGQTGRLAAMIELI